MSEIALSHLTHPLQSQPGIPLRVSVYSRIADAIREGRLRPGVLVPSESELGLALGVSRTVVREALMLLEEDGLIRAHRGVGRFVSEHAPRIGMERLRPLEDVLADPASKTTLRRVRETLEPTSASFIADGLDIGPGDPSWLWESVLERDGEPVALLQEHIPAGSRLDEFGPEVARIVEAASSGVLGAGEVSGGSAGQLPSPEHAPAAIPESIPESIPASGERPGEGSSLLRAFVDAFGAVFGPGQSEITLGVPGSTRGRLLGISASAPVLVLTQQAQYRGRPFYLAKQLLTAGAGTLTVSHAAPSRASAARA